MQLQDANQLLSYRINSALTVTSLVSGPNGLIAQLDGQLKHDAMVPLQEFFAEQLKKRGGASIVLICKGVSFVDSQGLALLLIIHRMCQNLGGALTVQSAPATLQNLLKLTRFDRILKMN